MAVDNLKTNVNVNDNINNNYNSDNNDNNNDNNDNNNNNNSNNENNKNNALSTRSCIIPLLIALYCMTKTSISSRDCKLSRVVLRTHSPVKKDMIV